MVSRALPPIVLLLALVLGVTSALTAPAGGGATYLPLTYRGNGYDLPQGNILLYSQGYDTGSNLFLTPPPPDTSPLQLTNFDNPEGVAFPSFSPDGAYIMYRVVNSGQGSFDFWVMAANGSPRFPLYSVQNAGIRLPEWGPDARTVTYFVNPYDADTNIGYTVNIESRTPITLATNLTGNLIWDYNTLRLYYSALNPNNTTQDLVRINADGTQQTVILPTNGEISPIDVLPDGRILVRMQDATHDDLYLVPPDGSAPTRLTFTPNAEITTGFSPDHRTLFFESSGAIFLMDVAGTILGQYTPPCPATAKCFYDHLASEWSPEGNEYAFVWVIVEPNSHYTFQLYTIAADGSQAQPTPILLEDAREVAYSSDGRYFAYDHDVGPRQVIVVVERATQTSQILSDPTDSLYVSEWRPLP